MGSIRVTQLPPFFFLGPSFTFFFVPCFHGLGFFMIEIGGWSVSSVYYGVVFFSKRGDRKWVMMGVLRRKMCKGVSWANEEY